MPFLRDFKSYFIGLALIMFTFYFLPFHRIKSNELADNAQGCAYYISLESILSNYPLLSNDSANSRFIKTRMLKFERDLKSRKSAAYVYQERYQNALAVYGVASIQAINNPNLIVGIANHTYKIIDDYYLDSQLFCINPLYTWRGDASRRILMYNLGGLFNGLPNRYFRAVSALTSDSQLGAFPGFFVNNQTTTLGTQFMTGMPMLTALYVMPGHTYERVGDYTALVPWGYFRPELFTDPIVRKILNISGIDILMVNRSDMARKNIATIPDAEELKSTIRPMFGSDIQIFANHQSYGMAYLANNVTLVRPIHHEEKEIKKYFSKPTHHNPQEFVEITQQLYHNLANFKDRYDVIVENKHRLRKFSYETANFADRIDIKGIVGPRAVIKTHCARKNCLLVLNTSDAPGWYAIVNNHFSRIYRANYAFMSTIVPHGDATVWFVYEPVSGVILYLINMLTLIIVLIVSIKKLNKGVIDDK